MQNWWKKIHPPSPSHPKKNTKISENPINPKISEIRKHPYFSLVLFRTFFQDREKSLLSGSNPCSWHFCTPNNQIRACVWSSLRTLIIIEENDRRGPRYRGSVLATIREYKLYDSLKKWKWGDYGGGWQGRGEQSTLKAASKMPSNATTGREISVHYIEWMRATARRAGAYASPRIFGVIFLALHKQNLFGRRYYNISTWTRQVQFSMFILCMRLKPLRANGSTIKLKIFRPPFKLTTRPTRAHTNPSRQRLLSVLDNYTGWFGFWRTIYRNISIYV